MSAFSTSSGAPVSNRWFTMTHLQEYLNRENREALRKTIMSKQIPMARFGNEYIIEDADFIAWIQANKSTRTDRNSVAVEATDSEAA